MSKPPDPEAEQHMARGKQLYNAGDIGGAADSFAAAARADSRSASAHFAFGVVSEALGHPAQALESYERALDVDPCMAKALVNAGNVLRSVGDSDGACERYRRALAIDARDHYALNNLAGIAFERRELDEAQALYERAVDSGSVAARTGLARTLARRGKDLQRARAYGEAERCYRHALSVEPRLAVALSGLGSVTLEMGDKASAISLFRQALSHDARDFEALNNLACIEVAEGDVAEAKRLFAAAAGVDPAQPEPRYNLGLIALGEHDFAAGWSTYELRMETDPETVALTTSALPRLTASTLPRAKRVAVRIEQGIGDQVLFSTLLPELGAAGLEAIVETDPRLVEAYRRSLPGLRFVPPAEAVTAFEACDHEIPAGSLPQLFRPDRASFARQPKTLLKANPVQARQIGVLLPSGPKIAVAWRSFQRGRHRSIGERKSAALRHFAPLAGEAWLVDLQHGDVSAERAQFDAAYPRVRIQVDGLDLFSDLEGVLAAIAACDLVVTTSNAVAHFAGALGKATWLIYLAARPPFHYWSPGPDGRSLWYPSVEVITDPAWTTWEPAFEAILQRWKTRRP